MKILQVFSFFSLPHGGGTVDLVYKLSQALMHRGHEVTIYASNFELDQAYVDSLQGIEVHPFRSFVDLPGLHLTPGLILEARRKLREFDIIHLHAYRCFQNIVIAHYAREYGVPYVLQAHGSLPRIMSKQRLKQVYDSFWGYKLLRDASKVIAITKTEVKQYKSMGISEDKIGIVPNGIDLSEFENLPGKGEFRRQYGINGNQKIILYLGRIHRIKSPDLLAEAFTCLSKDFSDAKLAIVGPDDGYLPFLKELVADLEIADKVLFAGPLYGQEKLKAYVDADVYVLPSFYEIFGITVLEALACGTPVIVTDRCGIADAIDGQAGLVVPYNKEQLQHALLRMLGDDRMRLEFSEKGKLLVRQKFNWEKIAGQVEIVYLGCLSSMIEPWRIN